MMKDTRTPVGLPWLAAALWLGLATTAVGAQDQGGRPELAKAAHAATTIVRTLESLNEQVIEALRNARAAQDAAADNSNTDLAEAAVELEKQVARLQEAVAAVSRELAEAQQRAVRIAPTEAVEAFAKARDAFEKALRTDDLATAQDSFEGVARDLRKPLLADNPEAEHLCVRADYWVGETMRRRAIQWLHIGSKDAQAENLLRLAIKQFQVVLDGEADATNTDEGSSVKAVAKHRIIAIEGSFYERYVRFRDNARVWPRIRDKARECQQHAEELFESLRRVHGDATMDNGQRITDVVARDIARMFGSAR